MINVARARTLEILESDSCLNTTATFASGERLVKLDLFTNELGKTQAQDKNIILFRGYCNEKTDKTTIQRTATFLVPTEDGEVFDFDWNIEEHSDDDEFCVLDYSDILQIIQTLTKGLRIQLRPWWETEN